MPDAQPTHDAAPDATEATATALAEAPFVSVQVAPDGDSIAATGVLVDGLARVDVPFHVRAIEPFDRAAETTPSDSDDAISVTIGPVSTPGDHHLASAGDARPASVTAFEIVRGFDIEPDPIRALAGVVAAGRSPGDAASGPILEAATRRGLVDNRPGVAIPIADLADGLAHSTLFHAPFSGDVNATTAMLAEVDLPTDLGDAAHTRLASRIAIDATGGDREAPARAVESLERALRPLETPTGPLETIAGFADVLETTATAAPGTAVAFGVYPGHEASRDSALEAWRTHAAATHETIAAAHTGRYAGLFVARISTDQPSILQTAARIISATRSPEPIVLVLGTEPIDGRFHAALHAEEPEAVSGTTETAVGEFDGRSYGTSTRAVVQIDRSDATGTDRDDLDGRFIAAVREAIA
ncbi:MAG: exonuclease RecJ [Halobacteriota archaeon]